MNADTAAETWRPVPGYEGAYSVSSAGRVRSERRRVQAVSRWGYPVTRTIPERILRPSGGAVRLSADGVAWCVRINRLIRETFTDKDKP